jgi:hypothetical protein
MCILQGSFLPLVAMVKDSVGVQASTADRENLAGCPLPIAVHVVERRPCAVISCNHRPLQRRVDVRLTYLPQLLYLCPGPCQISWLGTGLPQIAFCSFDWRNTRSHHQASLSPLVSGQFQCLVLRHEGAPNPENLDPLGG